MKTLTAAVAGLLLAAGSSAALAQDRTYGEERQSGSAVSVIARNGDGVIDREEAAAAGISDSQFQQMDTNGDGQVTESEYRNFIGQGGRSGRPGGMGTGTETDETR
jgi:hypothetical protein